MNILLAILAAVAVQSRVNISSQPSGAMVFVDGVNRGQTPLMLFDLKAGRHNLKYRLHGFVDADDTFVLDEGAVVDRNCLMEEELGLFLLKTDPAGCKITVDGLAAGETPRFFANLTTRSTHTIRLSKPGYRDQTISVKFNGREPLVREEKMVLDSGVVNILTDPAGAEVTVNGIVRGKTPLLVRDIPKGTAVVKLTLDGYREEVRELKMSAGEQQTLSLSMAGLPGTLHLLSSPAHAAFYVNEEARGVAPLSITGLQPGDYVVRCEAEGYAALTKTITIGNGQSAREEFKLSNVMGRVDLRTSPAGAEIFFDGRRMGVTKSSGGETAEWSDLYSIENVMTGEHALIIRYEGYHEVARSVMVKPKETAHVGKISLRRAFIPDVEVTTVSGVVRGVFKGRNDAAFVIETKPGTEYPIPANQVRNIRYLK